MTLRSRTATLVAAALAVLTAVGILFFTARPARAEEWCQDPTTHKRTIAPGQLIELDDGQLMICHDGELEIWIPGVNDFRQLRDVNAGLCLGVRNGSQASGAVLIQEACDNANHSQWWAEGNVAGYGLLINYHSGKCAAVAGSSQVDGAALVLEPCTTNHDRLWRKTSTGSAWRFTNFHSGKVISVPASARTPGLRLQQWRDLGHPDQRWAILYLV
jgi:Ricin-type beta-trefoil lectin domain